MDGGDYIPNTTLYRKQRNVYRKYFNKICTITMLKSHHENRMNQHYAVFEETIGKEKKHQLVEFGQK